MTPASRNGRGHARNVIPGPWSSLDAEKGAVAAADDPDAERAELLAERHADLWDVS